MIAERPIYILQPGDSDPREHFAYLRLRADVLKCCGIVDNLQIIEYSNKTIRAVCTKCHRRHLKIVAEPGKVGAERCP